MALMKMDVQALAVANQMNSSAPTESVFSRPGDAMVKTIVKIIPTKKDAQLQDLQVDPADSTNSSAQTDNASRNHSNVTPNQTVLITLMKLVVYSRWKSQSRLH
jgi:hypothetical protein